MAAQLERAAQERESLIDEIQGLNTGLQSRIQEALAALQAKNQELEKLMEGNALLREELAQQERLAVAGPAHRGLRPRGGHPAQPGEQPPAAAPGPERASATRPASAWA